MKPDSIIKFASSALAMLLFLINGAAAKTLSLEEGFRMLPNADKPWVYWWWLNGHVDEQTITRDLMAMREQGIGGVLLFDARGYHDDQSHVVVPAPKMEFMSAEWRQMVRFALGEASRMGLQVSINLSSCAGALKGPWLVGDDAPKRLIWTAREIPGGQRFSEQLEAPEEEAPGGKRFWNVGVFALRHDGPAPAVTLSNGWHVVNPALGTEQPAAEVVDLTSKLDGQDRLNWDAPAGKWTLVRFGYVTMEGHEYDVDVLDPKAVEAHFERMGKTLLKDAGSLAGKTLTHFYSVSWEGAVPTWTPALEKEFAKYRDYKLRPWMPVLAGFTLKSRDESERFLRDYYQTLGDTFRDNFYGTMETLCHRAGLQWHSESGGPWNRKLASFSDADQLTFLGRNDMPQGEFWFTGYPIKKRQEMNRPQAMTAHIYGKRLAATEAFTHMVQHWSAYPAVLKPFADAAFCDGVNHFIWHTFTCSPPEFGKPGSEYFAGTHLNPNVTWFPQAGPFLEYLGRCQYLLRQGKAVNDVCVYIGDKPYQHWGRGSNWSQRATLYLPPGYNYDLVNTEVLLERLKAKDGKLLLPDGMSYRLLVVDLDEETASPAALRKIEKLKDAGAIVVFGLRKPRQVPGLTGFPKADQEIRQLAEPLWSTPAVPVSVALREGLPMIQQAKMSGPKRHTILKEKTPASLLPALKSLNILPDFEGPWEYTHRRDGNTDIYFVSGEGAVECTFRVSGKQPELWNPVTGTITHAPVWRETADGRTIVPMALPQNGSILVLFRRPARPPLAVPLATSRPVEMALTGLWTVQFEPGRGAPASAEFAQLIPWDTHSDPGIRFFSGRATYRKTFDITQDQASRAARLQLGEVRCIAQVRLNGKNLGIVWTDPWSIDLSSAIKPGQNQLEIDVINTWVNRLIGDAALPPEQRITKSNLALQKGKRTLKLYQGFASEDPLMPSGLVGPVRLELER